MSESILYTYKAPKARVFTDEEIAKGIVADPPPFHPGVPLRDLTAADLDALPAHLQDTIAASDLYAATAEGKRWYAAIVRARTPETAPPKAPTPKE